MSIPNGVMIASAEAKHAIERLPEGASLRERFDAAASVTRDHWLALDEDSAFRSAVGGVLLTCSPEERVVIENAMADLHTLSALISGVVPVNLEQVAERAAEHETVPLLSWWKNEP